MNLQELREKAGLTQMELAKASGVSQGTISLIEIGKVKPRLATAAKLAAALGCTIDELVREGSA